jgi:hypothetical protein
VRKALNIELNKKQTLEKYFSSKLLLLSSETKDVTSRVVGKLI